MPVSAQQTTLSVPGMSCMHCVNAIKAALGQLSGVRDVRVDLAAKKVHVDYSPDAISPEILAKALAAAGYPVID